MSTTEVDQEMSEVEETEYTEAEQEHYHKIIKQEKIVHKLAEKAETAKQRAKAAREAYEEAASELHALIRHEPVQQKLPGMEDVDQHWRHRSLAELALGGTIVKALGAAEITTLGDLVAYQADGDGQPLTDIPGIGPATAEVITERLGQFWEKRSFRWVVQYPWRRS